MKLKSELVPRTLWGLSANKLLRSAWQREIRPTIVEEFENSCSVCEATTPRMYAHEQWNYDDTRAVAVLTGIALVCQDCNTCLHLGRCPPEHKAHALRHLAKVNAISVAEARQLEREAKTEWARRSGRAWSVEVDAALLARFPVLAALPERAAEATHARS